MNNEITTTDSKTVKPCVKCGAMDRNKHGQCSPCKRKSYEDNRDKVIERSRNWYEANREKAAERKRKYYEANREQSLERQRNYNRANRDKVAERVHKYYEANRDWIADINRKYREVNREKFRAYAQGRRAKIKGNGGKLSPNIVQTLMALQKGKCTCCGKSLKDGYHLDHIMPIALGGKNTDDNVQLLTPKCNRRKSDKHPEDWARLNGKLI